MIVTFRKDVLVARMLRIRVAPLPSGMLCYLSLAPSSPGVRIVTIGLLGIWEKFPLGSEAARQKQPQDDSHVCRLVCGPSFPIFGHITIIW